MKLIVLGAGYATRLYPLTLNQPKPLLPVAGKPMMEHVLDNLMPIEEIGEIFIVTTQNSPSTFRNGPKGTRPESKFDRLQSSMTPQLTIRISSARLAICTWSSMKRRLKTTS